MLVAAEFTAVVKAVTDTARTRSSCRSSTIGWQSPHGHMPEAERAVRQIRARLAGRNAVARGRLNSDRRGGRFVSGDERRLHDVVLIYGPVIGAERIS